MTAANTHVGYADKELVETQYFARAVSTGFTGDVQADQGELGKTLHLGAIDVLGLLEPFMYSQMTDYMLMVSRWSLLTPSAIWVTC